MSVDTWRSVAATAATGVASGGVRLATAWAPVCPDATDDDADEVEPPDDARVDDVAELLEDELLDDELDELDDEEASTVESPSELHAPNTSAPARTAAAPRRKMRTEE
jgi:hypothetical protein